jgi:hypothetical protein
MCSLIKGAVNCFRNRGSSLAKKFRKLSFNVPSFITLQLQRSIVKLSQLLLQKDIKYSAQIFT